MKRNRLGYYLKEGVGSIFTHGFMSFASVFIIVACLLIMGSFSLLALNLNHIVLALEQQNEVVAFVDEALSLDEALDLEQQLLRINNIAGLNFKTREEAMDTFLQQYESNRLFDDIDSSVFRHRYIINLHDIEAMRQTQKDILGIEGIIKVNAHLEISQGLVTLRNIISVVSLVLVLVLFIVSVFIMANTVKLTTFNRREEIAIMRMVGATNSFIRWPFIFEGMILGVLGSMIAYLLQWALYQLIASRIIGTSAVSFITFIPYNEIALPMLCVFGAIGLLVGVGGSLSAIKNYLKV